MQSTKSGDINIGGKRLFGTVALRERNAKVCSETTVRVTHM
jgi:hypothetical protein